LGEMTAVAKAVGPVGPETAARLARGEALRAVAAGADLDAAAARAELDGLVGEP